MTSDELRQWREGRGMTQIEAARWWGCTRRAWQRYESGERAIPAPLMKRIRSKK